jgi:hypothetical protein
VALAARWPRTGRALAAHWPIGGPGAEIQPCRAAAPAGVAVPASIFLAGAQEN